MRDRITLHDMRFQALVGVYPHERAIPQPIAIDLTAEVAPANGAIVDYAILYRHVADFMAAGHVDHIEQVAERIAAIALQMPGVVVAHVAVRKLHVALPGPLGYAEVRITRPSD
jgi:dihydroneopterin aldolase